MAVDVFNEAVALLGSRITADYLVAGIGFEDIEIAYAGTAGSVAVLVTR